jgi:uncharacterized membrane protein YfcA
MERQIAKGLRITFFIHFIVAGIFGLGLGFVFVPAMVAEFFGVEAAAPATDVYRVIGAAMLGWGLSSWLAAKAEKWESVRILVLAEILWTAAGAAVMLYSLLFNGFPPMGWITCGIFAAFAGAFAVFYRLE